MTLILQGGKLLLVGGKLAISTACCCGGGCNCGDITITFDTAGCTYYDSAFKTCTNQNNGHWTYTGDGLDIDIYLGTISDTSPGTASGTLTVTYGGTTRSTSITRQTNTNCYTLLYQNFALGPFPAGAKCEGTWYFTSSLTISCSV